MRPAGAAPPQRAYAQALGDVAAHVSLDEVFGQTAAAVQTHLGLLQKQAQVRVRNWLKKLSEQTANVVWKRNRNAYARLLLEQLRMGTLDAPFSGQPPAGPLPTLPKHLTYAFKSRQGGAGGSSPGAIPRPGSPAAAAATQQQQPPASYSQALQARGAPLPRHSQQQQQQQQQQQAAASASQQLDEYLGRADWRRAQHADEEEQDAAPVAAAWLPNSLACGGGGAQPCIPGTRMQLRGAEGRRVDRHQLGDVGWQPSKLELQAQLGASRERQAELEWRLASMEGLLRQHAALLQAPAATAPLGSLLDAIDDGSVSPPRQRAGKKELEELIERYEAKRQQWRSPSWAAAAPAPAASAGGGISPSRRRGGAGQAVDDSDGAEIREQLGLFQRQTESIRLAMGGGGGGLRDGGLDSADSWGGGSMASSMAAAASDWAMPDATPLHQHPTGLGGSGRTPHPSRQQDGSGGLFDGLPPTPAATRGPTNRHVQCAGHMKHSQQQQQPHATVQASSRRAVQASSQQPRSPIGPDVRHTKKSAAAAADKEAAAAAVTAAAADKADALQRLKSRGRPGSGASPAVAAAAAAEPPMQRQASSEEQPHAQQESPPRRPPPPLPPPDSNAALVAEVREMRSRLLASLEQHAADAPPTSHKQQRSWGGYDGWAASPSSSWRLPAGPVGEPALSPARTVGGSPFRLDEHSSLASGWAPATTTTAGSGSKFRMTSDEGGGGGISGRHMAGSLFGDGGFTDGGSLGEPFSLAAFEAQTESLARQLAGL